jgi:plastocyanin
MMMKKTVKQSVFLIFLLSLLGFDHAYATKWIINVQSFSFSPSSLPSVFVGDTVRWAWINGNHTTTSTVIPPGALTWDHPLNVSNQFFEYVPTIVGTYNYKCTPHAAMGMVGSFIVSPHPEISLNLKVFLEGPFNGAMMNTGLNTNGLIPLVQPYNGLPWNYAGTENVPFIPNADIVDWVLVELRETNGDGSTATIDKQIHRQAAFVLSDGSIVGLDGNSTITYEGVITDNLYVIIWHRNHLAVMSSEALSGFGGVYSYDFTDQLSKAYLNGQVSIGTNIFGMASGDADGNGLVSTNDKTLYWSINSGMASYFTSDFNLDRETNNNDKNDKWAQNLNKTSSVP